MAGGQRPAERAVALVVNGDDFGYSEAINEAIARCHREGVLTSATLLVNRPATGAALALARATPTLGVGLHLNLTEGPPVLPPEEVPSLVERGGHFRPFPAQLRAIVEGRARTVEVERELRAQFDLLLGRGLLPTHVDGHLHVHAYPRVLSLTLRLMAEFGVRAMRSPFLLAWLPLHLEARRARGGAGPASGAPPALGRRDRVWSAVERWQDWGGQRWSRSGALRQGARANLIRRHRVVLTDFLLDGARFLAHPDPVGAAVAALAPLRAGSVELMAHPAWNRDARRGAAEVALLTDPRLRAALDDLGVRLVHYGQLAAEGSPTVIDQIDGAAMTERQERQRADAGE